MYTNQSYTIGLLAKTEAQLSIFYSDFAYPAGDGTKDPIITKIPNVDKNILIDTIIELENVVSNEIKLQNISLRDLRFLFTYPTSYKSLTTLAAVTAKLSTETILASFNFFAVVGPI
jgi:hypothetical protein